MTNKQRANLIAFVHLIWILFGVVSLPLIFIIPGWNKLVLIFAGVTILSWMIFRGCWFLQIENKLRKKHDPKSSFEEESFIQHYLRKFFNLRLSRRNVKIIIYLYLTVLIFSSLLN